MSKKQISMEQIGAELVHTAKSQTQDSLPLSTRLFPYIYVASRRMSLRAMSAWLLEKHGVNLSAAAISRALNHEAMHLERLAEFIAPVARYVAVAYGCNAWSLLFQQEIENGPTQLHVLANHDCKQPESESDIPRWEELQYLASLWEPMPHEVQLMLEPYLSEMLSDSDSDDLPTNETPY